MKLRLRPMFASAALLILSTAPVMAPAQIVVADPAAQAVLTKMTATQQAMSAVQNNQLVTEAKTTAQQVQQVQQMIQDHIPVSSIVGGAGNSLLGSVNKNVGVFNSEVGMDQNVYNHFTSLVPSYDGTKSYAKYLADLKNNQYQVYGSALGVSNTELTNQTQVQSEIQKIASAPPANQLQALNQLVGIGKIQVNQMSSLLKIQSAMMKSMAVQYASAAQTGFGNSTLANAPINSATTIEYCRTAKPWIDSMGPEARGAEIQKCATEMPSNTTPKIGQTGP